MLGEVRHSGLEGMYKADVTDMNYLYFQLFIDRTSQDKRIIGL